MMMGAKKFGNYKLYRTLGEGAFAKVKRNKKNFNNIELFLKYSWYS